MANLKVDTVSGIGTEGVVLDGGLKFRSKNYMTLPKGNTTDAFPDFKAVPAASARGVFFGGITEPSPTKQSRIDYITISTTGDSIVFGDLTAANQFPTAFANNTRGVIAGGANPSITNIMEFVTMSTSGSSSDFGDLGTTRKSTGGCSDSHGGLGGY